MLFFYSICTGHTFKSSPGSYSSAPLEQQYLLCEGLILKWFVCQWAVSYWQLLKENPTAMPQHPWVTASDTSPWLGERQPWKKREWPNYRCFHYILGCKISIIFHVLYTWILSKGFAETQSPDVQRKHSGLLFTVLEVKEKNIIYI